MKLYRRNNSPNWWVGYSVNGQSKRVSTKRSNKEEALQVATTLVKRELDTFQLGIATGVPLIEAVDRYVSTQAGTSDYRNLQTRRNKLFGIGINAKTGQHWTETIWHLPRGFLLRNLKTSTIASLREMRKAEGLSNNSVNLEIRFLQRIWNLSKKEWDYEVHPRVKFRQLKVTAKTRYLSRQEEAQLLAAISGLDYLLAIILLDTGMRSDSEALKLRWRDVDLDRRPVRVFRPKTGKSAELFITERLHQALLNRLEFYGMDATPPYSERVVPTERACRRLRDRIHEICNDPEFPDPRGKATVHSMRDTFATRLVESGMSLHQISRLLGHSSISMTLKYAHLEQTPTSAIAVNKLNQQHLDHEYISDNS